MMLGGNDYGPISGRGRAKNAALTLIESQIKESISIERQ